MICSTRLVKVYKGGMKLWLSGILPHSIVPLLKFWEFMVLNTPSSAILSSTAEPSPALDTALSAWEIRHFQLRDECSNSSTEKIGKHILTDTSRCLMVAKRPDAHIRDENTSTPSHPYWRSNSTSRMSIASSSPKGLKGGDPAANWNPCRLGRRGPDRPRIMTQTWSSTPAPISVWVRGWDDVAVRATRHWNINTSFDQLGPLVSIEYLHYGWDYGCYRDTGVVYLHWHIW